MRRLIDPSRHVSSGRTARLVGSTPDEGMAGIVVGTGKLVEKVVVGS